MTIIFQAKPGEIGIFIDEVSVNGRVGRITPCERIADGTVSCWHGVCRYNGKEYQIKSDFLFGVKSACREFLLSEIKKVEEHRVDEFRQNFNEPHMQYILGTLIPAIGDSVYVTYDENGNHLDYWRNMPGEDCVAPYVVKYTRIKDGFHRDYFFYVDDKDFIKKS